MLPPPPLTPPGQLLALVCSAARREARGNDKSSTQIHARDRPKHGGANVGAWKTGGGRDGMAGGDRTERRRRNEADPRGCPWRRRRPAFDPRSTRPDAGRWQDDAGRRGAAPGSGPGGGVQRAAPPLLALPEPPPAEGHARTAVELAVRHGRGAGPAVQTLTTRDQGAIDAFAGIGAHARPVHPRVRADIGEAGGLVAISPRPAVPVRILPDRR